MNSGFALTILQSVRVAANFIALISVGFMLNMHNATEYHKHYSRFLNISNRVLLLQT